MQGSCLLSDPISESPVGPIDKGTGMPSAVSLSVLSWSVQSASYTNCRHYRHGQHQQGEARHEGHEQARARYGKAVTTIWQRQPDIVMLQEAGNRFFNVDFNATVQLLYDAYDVCRPLDLADVSYPTVAVLVKSKRTNSGCWHGTLVYR